MQTKLMEMKKKTESTAGLREFVLREGAALFGVAETAAVREWLNLSPETLSGLERAVSIGVHLSDRVLEDIVEGPTKLYFFHYQRVNIFLDTLALKATEYLQGRGWQALPIPASQVVDWERQAAHLSHKHAAREAGLGWIGRNNLLVTPKFGARVRLVTVLTDLPLPADGPLAADCGDCRACISSCPSGSIRERAADFDHPGCYQKIRELVKKAGISQNICGLCVKACRGRAGERL